MEWSEEMEMQMWEYVDGSCTTADAERIARLIASDELWKGKYEEVCAFQATMAQNLELDEPSMRFSRSVMEQVSLAKPARAARVYVSAKIVRSIAAFFIGIILVSITLFFSQVNWHENITGKSDNFKFNLHAWNDVFNIGTLNVAVLINIVLALLLADHLLRRKKQFKHLT